MLREYPMYFDDMAVPFSGYSESYETIENVNQSEAGTDLVNVTRYEKLSVAMTIKCLQPMVSALADFETKPSFVFRRYNPKVGDYENRTVRMRNFKVGLVAGSQDLSAVNGVWQVSFNLEEF